MGSRSSSSADMSRQRHNEQEDEQSHGEADQPNGRTARSARPTPAGEDSSRSRTTASRSASSSTSGSSGSNSQGRSEEDVDLAQVLAYLLRRGQVRLVHGGGETGLQLVQSYSDSEDDSDSAWDGRLGDRYNPPVDLNPDTREVDCSEIKTQILLATGAQGLKEKSFTRLLQTREQGRCHSTSFSHGERCHIRSHPEERRFCVFSLTASSDGREILGGANDGCLYVFDREQNKRTLKIDSHEDDVNAVAFADVSSQILFSGGDDALCKVWDRRTLREDNPQPVGHLAGHRDGITFIDSKGDARFLISNSKDQTIKLWDIRKFSPKEGLAASRKAVTQQNWDYRWQQVPKRVYDVLTGQIVTKLSNHDACVRDVSWHPFQENLVSSSWDGAIRLWEYRQTQFFDDDFVSVKAQIPETENEGDTL
ncbi:DCA11 factor, partial [Polypterus senegalus]